MNPESTMEKIEPVEVLKIECDRQINSMRFSPCGKFLYAAGYDASIRRWNLSGETPVEIERIAGHHGWVQWLEFQPSGELLFSVDSWGGILATRTADEKQSAAWSNAEAHDGWIRALSTSRDGTLLATGGRDRAARVWSAGSGNLLHEFNEHPHDVYAVAISPDNKTLVTGDLHGVLRLWDLETGKMASETKLEKMYFYDRIQDVAGLRLLRFHDDKTLICAGAEPQHAGRSIAIPTIHWLAWPSLEIQHTAQFGPQQHGWVFDLAFHKDGFWAVATSGQPGHGQFLLLKPGEEKPFFVTTKMSNCHSLDIHPDGRIAVAASNRNSQGNGAVKDKEGNYLGNYSPIHLFDPPPMDSGQEAENT